MIKLLIFYKQYEKLYRTLFPLEAPFEFPDFECAKQRHPAPWERHTNQPIAIEIETFCNRIEVFPTLKNA